MVKNYIMQIRIARGLTQEQLAEKMGITHTTVQRHESGKRSNLKWDTILKYADALGCHPSEITDGPGNATPPLTDFEKQVLEQLRGLDDSAKQMFLYGLKASKAAQLDKPADNNHEPEKKRDTQK